MSNARVSGPVRNAECLAALFDNSDLERENKKKNPKKAELSSVIYGCGGCAVFPSLGSSRIPRQKAHTSGMIMLPLGYCAVINAQFKDTLWLMFLSHSKDAECAAL